MYNILTFTTSNQNHKWSLINTRYKKLLTKTKQQKEHLFIY